MSKPTPRKDRLEELLALARTYRGWSQKQLADALGRDVHNLVPGGGVPRLDMVLRLAESLDWPVETVIADLCGQTPEPSKIPDENATWIELDRAAYAAAMEGRIGDRLTLASRAYAIAKTPDQRAYSSLREAGAWDQLGRYSNAMEAARRGLRERDLSPVVYCDLKGALANAHLMLGDIEEGEALASSLQSQLEGNPTFAAVYDGTRAFIRWLLGMSSHSRVLRGGNGAEQYARVAVSHYSSAAGIAARYAAESGSTLSQSMALTCQAGATTMQAFAGMLSWQEAVANLMEQLDTQETDFPAQDACLESVGWVCVFASEIVLRWSDDETFIDRQLAILTNKADEVARRTGNWALRERIWMLEYSRTELGTGIDFSATVLDPEDLRDLAGTMGRFPSFRQIGWSLLRTARRIEEV